MMKITVYDPYKTFIGFANHVGEKHHLRYVDKELGPKERAIFHYDSDVVWYEFCTDRFAYDTHTLEKMAYTVCRLHSYEIFTPSVMEVKWDRVGKLLTVMPFVRDLLRTKQRHIDFPPIDILFNGVNLDKFTFPNKKTYGKNLCILGFINHKKGLPLAIQCLDAVRNEGYHLHFIGESQDRRFDFYLGHIIKKLGLEKQVSFHGRLPHDGLLPALHEMDYLFSCSLFESFGQGIMEGAAAGCIPLIHDFPSAEETFGGIANIFRNTSDFATCLQVDRLTDNEQLIEDATERRDRLNKYSLSTAIRSLDTILEGLEGEVANA